MDILSPVASSLSELEKIVLGIAPLLHDTIKRAPIATILRQIDRAFFVDFGNVFFRIECVAQNASEQLESIE